MTVYYDRPTGSGFGLFFRGLLRSGTLMLILACLAVFLADALSVALFGRAARVFLRNWFYLSSDGLFSGKLWQLVTYALFHAGGGHLFGNLLSIFFFGGMVERVLGRREYLLFASYSVIFAAVLHTLVDIAAIHLLDKPSIPTVGISGFCFAVLTLGALLFPESRVYVMLMFPVPLWLVAVVLGVVTISGALEGGDGIAHWAHLGGIVFALWYYFQYMKKGRTLRLPSIPNVVAPIGRVVEEHRDRRDALVRERVDRLLDKINEVGISGLTEDEREFLRQSSKKYPRGKT